MIDPFVYLPESMMLAALATRDAIIIILISYVPEEYMFAKTKATF